MNGTETRAGPRGAEADERWMRNALALARRGMGATRPNPPVGAVIVRRGRIVGRGHHAKAGGPHAEIVALRKAGIRSRGATLYLTMEPCCTWGRTGPCTEAILHGGISRVVVSVRDPNPRHRGRGLRVLRSAGIAVAEGICRDQGADLIAPFAKWIATGRPYVTLKLGVSLDGKIADGQGRSKWITSPASRALVKRMRGAVDAVLVGSLTAVVDDPALRCNQSAPGNPYRVVVDTRGRISPEARLLSDGLAGRTIVATTSLCSLRRRGAYRAKGACVLALPRSEGRVSLSALLAELGKRGLLHVLCEGGGELAESLIRGRLVDDVLLFMAPIVLGGRRSVPAVGGRGWALRDTPRLRIREIRRVGGDLLLRAEPCLRA